MVEVLLAVSTSVRVGVALPAGQFVPLWRQTEFPFTRMLETKSAEPDALVKDKPVVVTFVNRALVPVRSCNTDVPPTVRVEALNAPAAKVEIVPEVAWKFVANKLV